jgi:hypothetical protein
MLRVGCWLRWPGDCIVAWKTVGSACSSLGRAVQWRPMKPDSSPICSCRWLHCDLQNVPHEHANCTAQTQRANWPESSSWLKFKFKLYYNRRSVCLGVRHPFRTRDQFFFLSWIIFRRFWFNDVGRFLWREVGSVVLSWVQFIDSIFETPPTWRVMCICFPRNRVAQLSIVY